MTPIGQINWRDVAHVLIVIVGGSFLTWLGEFVVGIQFVTDPALNAMIISVLSTGIAYLSKKIASDQDNKFLGVI